MTRNDVINGIFVNDGVSLEQKLHDKHKDILPAIDKRYTLTVVFTPNKTQVLMVLHNKQHMLNFVGGHIEPGEDEMEASYRELFEETGITKDAEWYLYITAGILKHDVELKEEKNSLHWVSVIDNRVLLGDTFGDGNCYVYVRRALSALNEE